MRTALRVTAFAALILIVAVPHPFAAEEAHGAHDESEHHRNLVEFLIGNTYEDADDGSENGFTVGVSYERRISGLLGVGAFYEYAAGDFDKWSIGVPLFIHPYKGLRFQVAPGLEHRQGEDELLLRTGVGYEFSLSDRWMMMPELAIDFVDGDESLVFGLVFGFGF